MTFYFIQCQFYWFFVKYLGKTVAEPAIFIPLQLIADYSSCIRFFEKKEGDTV
jgi:hypothetical protein